MDLTVIKVLKKDIFGKIELAKLTDNSLVICRNYSCAKFYGRPFASYLAYRERKILKIIEHLNSGNLPRLIHHEKGWHVRSYVEGVPLNQRQIKDAIYYENAKKVLNSIHSCGVVHNDIEKPENWLVIGENNAGIIDFQLALFFPNKGKLFRTFAKEDLRHLIKQKARFCPEHLTGEEKVILGNKTFPARIWMKYFKPIYNFVTRRILGYSDRSRSQYSR